MARWKHGKRSAAAIWERRESRQRVRARDAFLDWLGNGADRHFALSTSILDRIYALDPHNLVADCRRWLRLDDEQNRVIAFMEETHGEIRQRRGTRRMQCFVRNLIELGANGMPVEDLRTLWVAEINSWQQRLRSYADGRPPRLRSMIHSPIESKLMPSDHRR